MPKNALRDALMSYVVEQTNAMVRRFAPEFELPGFMAGYRSNTPDGAYRTCPRGGRLMSFFHVISSAFMKCCIRTVQCQFLRCPLSGGVIAFLAICLSAATALADRPDQKSFGGENIQEDSGFVPQGYEKVFADEMNDPKLDTSKWWTRYIYEGGKLDTLNDERQLFRENGNHIMTGRTLELTAYLDPDLKPPRFLYRSGMIRSKMTFKYGYFEARLKMPKGRGVWPCFWLNSDARSDGKIQWPPEIDIAEFVYNGKDDRANMMHVAMPVRPPKGKSASEIWNGELLEAHPNLKKTGTGGHYHAPFDFPDDFHVFAALWDADDTVTIYIDGELVMKRNYNWVYNDKTDAGYAHVLLNLSIGGQWAGRYGIDDSAFPQAMEVDYVRVYQKADSKLTGQSTIGTDFIEGDAGNAAGEKAQTATPAAQ